MPIRKQWIVYYGVLQGAHLVFLTLLLAQTDWVFGFLNNATDWSPQFINMFKAISVLDMVNALFSLRFVHLFLKDDQRARSLGICVLTASVYSGLVFGVGIFWNQLHVGNVWLLNAFSLPFLPVFYIWLKFVFGTSESQGEP